MASKHIVVTGASGGIGIEFVHQFLGKGYRVTAIARRLEGGSELEQLVFDHKDHLRFIAADVTLPSDIEKIGEKLSADPIDFLINNAGVYLDRNKSFENLHFEEVLKTFEVNAIGPMRIIRCLLPMLKRSKSAKVINISSLMGSIADNSSGESYAYRMSKAALNMFNKSLSCDYPTLTCLVMHPGWVKTKMGGEEAPTLPEESVRGMIEVIERCTSKDSGRFFDFEGDELPW